MKRSKLHLIRLSRRDIAPLKRKARVLVLERCAYFARQFGVSYHTVSIGAARTRWGSCSSKGAIRFNYKLAALPPHLADLVIVHEICHLRHLNHSADFWRMVERAFPEHRALRKELRRVAFTFRPR